MCGIVGIVGRRDDATVGTMCASIRSRGPDERGTTSGENVSLGMQRLSIVDLEGGSQPIENEDGSVSVIFNGEIYNHESLRNQLRSQGHQFTTGSDTEALVHGYEEWGTDLVTKLNGMFAFAIWDRDREVVVLGRDRLGIKPLYYAPVDGAVVFASELTALLEHPAVEPEINATALKQYWVFRYIPAPNTIINGIRKLEPATVATIPTHDPKITTERYWSLESSPEQSSESLRGLLESAVRDRLMADVPLGAFLSGGLDSTTVVALMNEASFEPVETFSIGFTNSEYDESSFARRVADDLGTRHHELTVTTESMQIFDDVVAHMDEPLADPAMIPTYLLSERAAENVKVVLTGEGSDELFAGYNRYSRYTNWWDTFGGYHNTVYSAADAIGSRFPKAMKARRYLQYLAAHRDHASAFETIMTPREEAFDFDTESVQRACRPCIETAMNGDGDYLRKQLRFDQLYTLPDNLLTKVDRMTMANSLEARVPFLDHRIVEFANAMDSRDHLGDRPKPVLQEAVRDLVPDYVRRREKHGFHLPIREWFEQPLDAIAATLVSDRIDAVPYLDFEKVDEMFCAHRSGNRNCTHYLWRVLVYVKWYHRHIAHRTE